MAEPTEKEEVTILFYDKMPLTDDKGRTTWGWVATWVDINGRQHATNIHKENPTEKDVEEAVKNDARYIHKMVGRKVTL